METVAFVTLGMTLRNIHKNQVMYVVTEIEGCPRPLKQILMTPAPKMTVYVLSLRKSIIQTVKGKWLRKNWWERTHKVCGILVKETAFREFLDWLMSGTRKFQSGKNHMGELSKPGSCPHKLNENAETLMSWWLKTTAWADLCVSCSRQPLLWNPTILLMRTE